MVDQLTLQTVGILLTGLTVSIAAIYYTLTLRYTRRNQELQLEARNLQLFMQLYQQMSTPGAFQTIMEIMFYEWDDVDDFVRKYGERNNLEAYGKYMSVMRRYNTIGLLLRDNHIDAELIWDYIGTTVITTWDKYGEVIKEMRVRLNLPNLLEWFEFLVDEMKIISSNRGFSESHTYPWRTSNQEE